MEGYVIGWIMGYILVGIFFGSLAKSLGTRKGYGYDDCRRFFWLGFGANLFCFLYVVGLPVAHEKQVELMVEALNLSDLGVALKRSDEASVAREKRAKPENASMPKQSSTPEEVVHNKGESAVAVRPNKSTFPGCIACPNCATEQRHENEACWKCGTVFMRDA